MEIPKYDNLTLEQEQYLAEKLKALGGANKVLEDIYESFSEDKRIGGLTFEEEDTGFSLTVSGNVTTLKSRSQGVIHLSTAQFFSFAEEEVLKRQEQ